MSRTRSRDHEAQRDHIVDLAAEMFAKTSYASTTMSSLAAATGNSKAWLYHYYQSKEAILFDLLDRYTRRLLQIATDIEEAHEKKQFEDRDTVVALVTAFLAEYEASRFRHVAMINDAKYLTDAQQEVLRERQRRIVHVFSNSLANAYPNRVTEKNKSVIAMMLFGSINWTFLWLKPEGEVSYNSYAIDVLNVFENGLSEIKDELPRQTQCKVCRKFLHPSARAQ